MRTHTYIQMAHDVPPAEHEPLVDGDAVSPRGRSQLSSSTGFTGSDVSNSSSDWDDFDAHGDFIVASKGQDPHVDSQMETVDDVFQLHSVRHKSNLAPT